MTVPPTLRVRSHLSSQQLRSYHRSILVCESAATRCPYPYKGYVDDDVDALPLPPSTKLVGTFTSAIGCQLLYSIHRAFKMHITAHRPQLAATIDDVATGEAWLAVEAKGLGLVDEIMTSDEYIAQRSACVDVIAMNKVCFYLPLHFK